MKIELTADAIQTIDRLKHLDGIMTTGAWDKLTTKEKINMAKEFTDLEAKLGRQVLDATARC